MKTRQPTVKHAQQVFGRSIDAAIKAHREFEAAIGPTFESAKKLAARAVIAADQIEVFINTITREVVPVPAVMIAGLFQVAAKLRAEAEAARKALG